MDALLQKCRLTPEVHINTDVDSMTSVFVSLKTNAFIYIYIYMLQKNVPHRDWLALYSVLAEHLPTHIADS